MNKTPVSGWVPFNDVNIHKGIISELEKKKFNLSYLAIDPAEYDDYMQKANYAEFQDYYAHYKTKPTFIEKTFEHFLAAKLLDLTEEDIYIDVANSYSPVPEIYNKLFGCRTFRQDILFPEGISDNVIGGDAANMPLEDGFATKMGLHCSFEHFEGDADMRFIREASRVLRNGGRLCIVPLYLFNTYAIQTDISVLPEGMELDPDASIYQAEGWGERHGRFYDVLRLISRIRNNLCNLSLKIYVITNAHEIDASCYLKFAALFLKNKSGIWQKFCRHIFL